MDSFAELVQIFFVWLLRTTLQVSALICLVLLAQWALRRWLGVHGRYLLWGIIVLRMVMPWTPPSRFSVFNLLPSWGQNHAVRLDQARQNTVPIEMSQETTSAKARKQNALAEKSGSGAISYVYAHSPRQQQLIRQATVLLPLLWLAGVLFLTLRILIHTIRIRRVIQAAPPLTDTALEDLLDNCRRKIGTHRTLTVIAGEKINSPALFGFFRAHLLIPRYMLEKNNHATLRYVFLHEIAHLKRCDVLVGMITSALHVLHWFNPLVGFGFKRLRADRELACDGFVLSRLHAHEVRAYGHTILRQFELLLLARSNPLLTGFLGGKARIKERIAAISHFKRETWYWVPLAICLLIGLAFTGLTDVHTSAALAEFAQTTRTKEPATAVAGPLSKTYAHTVEVQLKHIETGLYLVTDGQKVTCDASEPGSDGLWEARFNGSLGHGGGVLLYSVAHDGYLSYDSEGNLVLRQMPSTNGSNWIVMARPQGVWIITEDIDHNYLRVDEQTPVKAEHMGRDEFSYWDVIQLNREPH